MISIVCPFYNERSILQASVKNMLHNLSKIDEEWELIIVNDGSTDDSFEIATELSINYENLQVKSYEKNKGRGFALRTGIKAAKGRYIFTTEIDSSWGDDIIENMYNALEKNHKADMVIASPNLSGGGYKNVPAFRVYLSRIGNYIIRTGMSYSTTMNTGMTRGYRAQIIKEIPLYENGKEFHLEVVLKALSMNLNIIEVPAILEWKDYKLDKKPVKRKSSSKIKRLAKSHLLFSVLASPIRYLWALSILSIFFSFSSLIYATYRYFSQEPWAYAILGVVGFSVLGILLFSFGVLSQQNRLLMNEIWRIQLSVNRVTESNIKRE